MWLAGGGIKGGVTLGESDEFGFNVTSERVHVHDLHATIQYLLGFDHTRLNYRFQGLDQRLTGSNRRALSGKSWRSDSGVFLSIWSLRLVLQFLAGEHGRHVPTMPLMSIRCS